MKKQFEAPEIQVQNFSVEDIVTVSGYQGIGGENETQERF